MDIIIAFILRLLDNSLNTAKTVFISKEKYLYGAIFASASTFFYLIALVRVVKDNSIWSILAICLATLIGTYLPGNLIKRSEKDKLFIFDITGKTFEYGKEIADTLREANIAIRTELAYDHELEKTLVCKVYCQTKQESTQVIELLNNVNNKHKVKWHVYTPLEI